MRTQVTLVQHNEQELEAKRLHCKSDVLPRLHAHANTTQTSKSSKLSRVRFDFFLVIELTVGNMFLVVARTINDDEQADPTTPAADKRRSVAGRQVSHAAIIDAYDWDDVHPSRCVIL
jgi:hypothetical protein